MTEITKQQQFQEDKERKKKVFFSFLFIKATTWRLKEKTTPFFFASLPPLPAVENFF